MDQCQCSLIFDKNTLLKAIRFDESFAGRNHASSYGEG